MASGNSNIKAGALVSLSQINPSSPFFIHGSSLRVVGRLQDYSVETGLATIVHEGASLRISTEHLRDLNFRVGSIYQFIGELNIQPDNEAVLLARVGRNVDGVDLNLYHHSLQLVRQFQAEQMSKQTE